MMPRDFSKFLIATDLDGTFIFHGHFVPANVRAAAEFRAGGGVFTIATGRLHNNVRSAVGEPTSLCNAPAALCSGAYLYDFQKDRIVPGSASFIDPADVREILAMLRADFPNMVFRVSTPGNQYMERLTGPLVVDASTFDPGTVSVRAPAEEWRDDNWLKIVVRGTPADLKRLADTATARFAGRLFCFFSGPKLFEMQRAGVNKGVGLAKLAALYPGRITVGCGDYENDLALLKTADIAACPADAYGPAKALCDVVLPSCEAGIFPALLDYLAAWQERRKSAK